MEDSQQRLRRWFEREETHPRRSVVEAIDSLGLRDGDRVIDIGCGPGVHLRHFLHHVAPEGEVVGLDTNQERLDVASRMLGEEIEHGGIRLVKGDMHQPDLDLGHFDLVWMSLVLHHEDVPVETIRDLRQLLGSGGRIAVLDGDDLASFPFIPWPPEFEMTIREAVRRAADEKRFTARYVRKILRDAGLSNVRLRPFSDVRQAPLDDWDREDIQGWFLNSFSSRIRDYLAPDEWKRYESHFDSDSPDYLLDSPEFFLVRTWFLAVGTET